MSRLMTKQSRSSTEQLELMTAADHTWFDWRQYLVNELGYPDSSLSMNDSVRLIAIHGEAGRKHQIAVIGTNDESARSAAETVGRRLGARFIALGHPANYQMVQIAPNGVTTSPIQKLPCFVASLRRRGPISRTHVLPPFRDEEHIRRAFAACHDAMYLQAAKDPAAAFDLLLLLLAAKVMDEQADDGEYQFCQFADEKPTVTSARLVQLMAAARAVLWNGQTTHWQVPNGLHSRVVGVILEALQGHSITLSSIAPDGTDLLGIAYEELVGDTFRGELGSYFTPRNIADFMVRLLNVNNGMVFDPSCGSAGLLMAAFRRHRTESYATKLELYGNDLNPRMVETSRLNFVLHGLDPRNVLEGDGLELPRILNAFLGLESASGTTAYWDSSPGVFDYVLANPPFAGHVREKEVLRHFGTAISSSGRLRSLNRTLPFMEVIVAALKEGGKAGIVLPISVLNGEEESFVRFRELLLERSELLAIVELPEKAFVHTGCGIHGALLFFRRTPRPRTEYDVFVTSVEHVGYDTLGKATKRNELLDVVDRYRSGGWLAHERISVNHLRREQRWDPFWLRIQREMAQVAVDSSTTLADLLELRDAHWPRRQIDPEGTYIYFEVGDADIESGAIRHVHTVTGFELGKKGRIRYRVRAGDVLLPNHRDSLMASGARNGRSAVIVTPQHDGILTTDRWLVLTPRVDAKLLVAILNAEEVRRQLIAHARGAASLDIREGTLRKVRLPRSLVADHATEEIVRLVEAQERARQQLENDEAQLAQVIARHFSSPKVNPDLTDSGQQHIATRPWPRPLETV